MSAYWVRFTDTSVACVESHEGMLAAQNKAAGATGKIVQSIKILPYAAEPVVGVRITYEFTNGKKIVQPTFCYKPDECAGRSACPQQRSCTE